MADILLMNIRSPRIRTLSDTILENGLSILKESLRKDGLEAIIEDQGNVDFYQSLSPKYITKPLHFLAGQALKSNSKKNKSDTSSFFENVYVGLQKKLDLVQSKRLKNYYDKILDFVEENEIPVIGKKVWYGSSYIWSNIFTEMVNDRLPEVFVLDGGPHPSIYQEHYVRNSPADLVILSEGEPVLSDLIFTIKDFKEKGYSKTEISDLIKQSDFNNIAFMRNDDFFKRPVKRVNPNKKINQVIDDQNQTKLGIVIDALGCPYNDCNFCNYKNIYPSYLAKKPDPVIDEIKYLLSNGIGLFRFSSGSNSLDHSVKLASKIIDHNLKINYSFFDRCQSNAKEKYDELKEKYKILINSGLRSIFYGPESGDDVVLKEVMNKELLREDIIYSVKAMQEVAQELDTNVDVILSVIYPHPTNDGVNLNVAFDNTYSLIEESMPDSVLVNLPGPFPNSTWFNEDKYGFGYYNPDKPGLIYSDKTKKDYIAKEMMELNYLLYLPPRLWKKSNITLDGKTMSDLFILNDKLRQAIKGLGVNLDISDEHFLMLRAAGYTSQKDIDDFKTKSMQSIISCNYDFLNDFYKKVNAGSEKIASIND